MHVCTYQFIVSETDYDLSLIFFYLLYNFQLFYYKSRHEMKIGFKLGIRQLQVDCSHTKPCVTTHYLNDFSVPLILCNAI